MKEERKTGKNGSDSILTSPVMRLAFSVFDKKNVTLAELVDDLSLQLHLERDQVIQELMRAREEKKIRIEEAKPYSSLREFVFSPYAFWFWTLIASTFVSLVLIFVTSGLGIYLRYFFGSILVLFLPGYALVELLYSKRKELDDLTRLALSIGLSLAIVPLVGLVLNYTAFGIRLIPIAVSLGGLTLLLLVGALVRKFSYYRLASYAR
jgi:hypothetical protein